MSAVLPGRSADLAHRFAPELVPAHAAERSITADQTNHSVVVGEAVVVKWLTAAVEPPHRGAHLMAHLAEVGFHAVPPLYGAHVEQGRVVAVVTGFVVGALDGWDWYVDELLAALPSGSLVTPLATAERVGRLAATMSNALATPSSLIVEPFATASLGPEHRRGMALLDEALACTNGAVQEALAERSDRIASAIGALAETGEVPVQPTHGDLHVGQILRSGDRLLVNDFDGNPVGGSPDPRELRSVMVDLASLMQSIDHVGRIAVRRAPEHTDLIHEFIEAAVPRTRRSFLGELSPHLPPTAGEIEIALAGLSAIQELHELVYATRHLPRWAYVPHASLMAMFP